MGFIEDRIEHIAATVALEGQRTRAELSGAFAETVRGARIDGALPRSIRPNAANYGSGGRLVGWSIRATGGEVVLDLYDGAAPDPDRYLGALDLAAGASQTVAVTPGGVSFVDGLYVASTGAGTPIGALWIGAVD